MNVCIDGVTCVLRPKISLRYQSAESIQTVFVCLLAFFILSSYRISHWYLWLANLVRPSSPRNWPPHFWRLQTRTTMPGYLQIYTINILSTETSPCLLRKYLLAMHRMGMRYSTLLQHFSRKWKNIYYTPRSANK